MRYGRLRRYLMLGEGHNIDMSDISYIKKIPRGYEYYVNGVLYNTKFYNKGDNDWEIKFGDVDKSGDINIKMLNTLTYSTVKEILTNVAKTLVMFIKLQKPRSVMYTTDTRSRVISYKRLYELLRGNKEIMGYYTDSIDNNLHYIIKNDVDIRDIVKVM